MYLFDILIEHPVRHLDMTFTYYYDQPLAIYTRVQVAFGHQKVVGFILNRTPIDSSLHDIEKQKGFQIRPITEVIDQQPILNEELYQLALYLKKITCSPLITCLKTMLPPSLKPQHNAKITEHQLIYVYHLKDIDGLTPRQQAYLDHIREVKMEPLKDVGVSKSVLNKLEAYGCIELKKTHVDRKVEYVTKERNYSLNHWQQNAVDTILHTSSTKPFLLFGITGSGKTDVYLHCCLEMMARGKQSLLLVPEIALTPTMVNIFKTSFGEKVAVLHSKLSAGVRYDEYLRIKNQQVQIVIGTRSAIFAPLDHLGLIIMDEEHDSSYKQQTTPYYHVRDLALFRQTYHQARMVLGSASPSIESFARAKRGSYHLIEMPERATQMTLPSYEIIDMGSEAREGNLDYFSRAFQKALTQCLDDGNQALVFVNRRGYASQVLCQACGYIPKCPHCDVTLTYHKDQSALVCHYCNYQEPYHHVCPSCQGKLIAYKGIGTEQYQDMISQKFKKAKVLRYDFDTTKMKGGHQKLISSFEDETYNVLLGTQMIAKGLDFKKVTLVAVLDADVGLSIPDFRSSERVFQLLLQVAGRAGRHAQGHVLIQTYNPYHPAIVYGAKQDYYLFFKQELEVRRKTLFPPYCYVLSIIVSSKDEVKAQTKALRIAEGIRSACLEGVVLSMPQPSVIAKINDYVRYRMNIKYTKSKQLFELLHQLIDDESQIKVEVDVNPYTLL